MSTTSPNIGPPNNRKRGRRIIKVGALSYAQLVLHMLEGTYSCTELAEITGLHYVTVLQYTREMYLAGACHISSWEKDPRGRDITKIYKIGKGRDKLREKLSQVERMQRCRSKQQAIKMNSMMVGQAVAP